MMRELLIRWAKAEPERCRERGETFMVLWADAWTDIAHAGEDGAGHVQLAAQEAIEARGWTWRLNGPSQLNGKREWGPTATVFGDRLGTALGYYGELGDERSAAYSLLAAYLKAIDEAKRRARIDKQWEAA